MSISISHLTNQQRWAAAGAASLAMAGVLGVVMHETGQRAASDVAQRLQPVSTGAEGLAGSGDPWLTAMESAVVDMPGLSLASPVAGEPLSTTNAASPAAMAVAIGTSGSSAVTLSPSSMIAADESTSSTPQQIVITLPSYQAGRLPSASPPTVSGGSSPSVQQTGANQYTVNLGTTPTVTPATVDTGASGRLTPPSVELR